MLFRSIKSFLFKFPEIRAKLPRAELQALGIKAGPEFDRILAHIFALQLDGKIKSHLQLMKEMRESAGIKEPPPPPAPAPKKGKGKPAELVAVAAHKKGKGEPAPTPPPPEQKGKAAVAAAAAKVGTHPPPAKTGARWGHARGAVTPAPASAHSAKKKTKKQ